MAQKQWQIAVIISENAKDQIRISARWVVSVVFLYALPILLVLVSSATMQLSLTVRVAC